MRPRWDPFRFVVQVLSPYCGFKTDVNDTTTEMLHCERRAIMAETVKTNGSRAVVALIKHPVLRGLVEGGIAGVQSAAIASAERDAKHLLKPTSGSAYQTQRWRTRSRPHNAPVAITLSNQGANHVQ